MSKYKINFRSTFSHLNSILIFGIIAVVINVVKLPDDSIIYNSLNLINILIISQTLICIILFVNYLSVNINDEFQFDEVYGKYIYTHNGETIVFYTRDIEKIEIYKSIPKHTKKGFHYLFWDDYFHYVFYLNNGNRITITSLLVLQELKLTLSCDRINNKVNVLRWANKSLLPKV